MRKIVQYVNLRFEILSIKFWFLYEIQCMTTNKTTKNNGSLCSKIKL